MKTIYKVILVFMVSYLSIVTISKLKVDNKHKQFQDTTKSLEKEGNLRNENGTFTKEYYKALEKVKGNTASNLAPITAIPYSLIVTILLYFILFRKRIKNIEL